MHAAVANAKADTRGSCTRHPQAWQRACFGQSICVAVSTPLGGD